MRPSQVKQGRRVLLDGRPGKTYYIISHLMKVIGRELFICQVIPEDDNRCMTVEIEMLLLPKDDPEYEA